MTDNADILIVLKSIDMTLRELLTLSKAKRAVIQPVLTPQEKAAILVADAAELDSPRGDEEVKFSPRGWTGDFTKGQRMSECSPEFLDQLAAAHDYFATKNAADPTKAGYEVRSARRARGWSARLRAGWKPKTVEPMTSDSMNW